MPDLHVPVIFDTDPGIDDAMALLFLNASRRLALKGITTVFGNASVTQCTNNALYLCERFQIEVPVHMGANKTITGLAEERYPAFVHGEDGLANIQASPAHRTAGGKPAHEFLCDMARTFRGELIIIAVGRMTNLARAIRSDPGFCRNVKAVVLMGGAVHVPGNVSHWAEANIYGDPEAAQVLFSSGMPVTQVGLDVTMKTLMSGDYISDLIPRTGDAGKLLAQITPYYLDYFKSVTGFDGFACHDSSAIACVEDPAIYQTVKGKLSVVLEGQERGRTVFEEDRQGHHTLCTDVDVARILDDYAQYLVRAYGG